MNADHRIFVVEMQFVRTLLGAIGVNVDTDTRKCHHNQRVTAEVSILKTLPGLISWGEIWNTVKNLPDFVLYLINFNL